VKCVAGPSVSIKTEVKFAGGKDFKNANKPKKAPKGIVGDSGFYRLTVTNTGDEPLTNVVVKDNKLGINKVIQDLAVGEKKTIGFKVGGFSALRVDDLCPVTGTQLNSAQISATGVWTGEAVSDGDPAYVKCKPVPVCTLTVDKVCSVSVASNPFYEQTNADQCEIPKAGTNVTYRYVVQNTGNTPVTLNSLKDSKLGNVLSQSSVNLAAGKKRTFTLDPVFVKGKQSSSVTVKGVTSQGAQCQSTDLLKITPTAPPVAENEVGMVIGDPHFYGGDGGKWGFHGKHLAMFNLLSDTNLQVNTQYIARNPSVSETRHVYLGNTRINLHKVGGKSYAIQLSVDGKAHVNGKQLASGATMSLANGTKITYKANPGDKKLELLEPRGLRKTLGVLKVWTAEGYFIELATFRAYEQHPNHVDMAVRTPMKGVKNGRMPSGILGQSFDADDEPMLGKDVNGWSFEVNSL